MAQLKLFPKWERIKKLEEEIDMAYKMFPSWKEEMCYGGQTIEEWYPRLNEWKRELKELKNDQ